MAGVSFLGELCENAGAIIDLIIIAGLVMRMVALAMLIETRAMKY